METLENIGFGDIKLIQSQSAFRYGIDAVILADFANSIAPDAGKIADLGCGNGIIPFILSTKNEHSHITGIELQEEAFELACRNNEINGLKDRIDFVNSDINDLKDNRKDFAAAFDSVVSNPPYFTKGGGIPNSNQAKFIARHETTADVEDFIKTAAWMLDKNGHFFMVHRPSRLVDIFYHCRKYKLEPKDIRFVIPAEGEVPNIVLIHCVKNGGRELNYHKNLIVYKSKGIYSDEIESIYGRI